MSCWARNTLMDNWEAFAREAEAERDAQERAIDARERRDREAMADQHVAPMLVRARENFDTAMAVASDQFEKNSIEHHLAANYAEKCLLKAQAGARLERALFLSWLEEWDDIGIDFEDFKRQQAAGSQVSS